MSQQQRTKLPSQAELKKVVKAALEGGAGQVRIETALMVITATKDNADRVVSDALHHWERKNG